MLMQRIIKKHLFFPFLGFRRLKRQRGERWAALVEEVNALPLTDPRVIAFRLTIDRIRRALGQQQTSCGDRFCAMCISDILDDYDGTEDELLAYYQSCLDEVRFEIRALRARARYARQKAEAQRLAA